MEWYVSFLGMALVFAGVENKCAEQLSSSDSEEHASSDNEVRVQYLIFTVGSAQIMPHEQLDGATRLSPEQQNALREKQDRQRRAHEYILRHCCNHICDVECAFGIKQQ